MVKIIVDKGRHLFAIVFYAPPDQIDEAHQSLRNELSFLNDRFGSCPLIIMGDFNQTPKAKRIQFLEESFRLETAGSFTQGTRQNRIIDFFMTRDLSLTDLHVG